MVINFKIYDSKNAKVFYQNDFTGIGKQKYDMWALEDYYGFAPHRSKQSAEASINDLIDQINKTAPNL